MYAGRLKQGRWGTRGMFGGWRRFFTVLVAVFMVVSVAPVVDGGLLIAAEAQVPVEEVVPPPPDEEPEPVFDGEDVASRGREHVKAPNSDVVAVELAKPGLVARIEKLSSKRVTDEGVERDRFEQTGFPVRVETLAAALVDGVAAEVEIVDPALGSRLSPFGSVFALRFVDTEDARVASSGPVTVTVDFTDVGITAGGGAQERVGIALFSGCVADREGVLSCAGSEPVATTRGAGRTLIVELTAAQVLSVQGRVAAEPFRSDGFQTLAGGGSGSGYFGIVTGPGGPNGNYAASVGTGPAFFEVGLQAGTAQASYPISLPPAAVGPMPSVALRYSSAIPDGMSAAENTQASWVGLGWNLAAGSIARHYQTCEDAAHEDDLCDAGDFYSITLGGVSSPLIQESPGGDDFRLASDPHWRVTRKFVVESLNPDDQGEYWEVATTDGTVFTFGRNKTIAAWPAQNSVQYVWVHSPDAGGACDAFAGDSCDKGWRWDLSTTTDTNGNEINYFYDQETNQFHSGDGGTLKTYVRAAHLAHITYSEGKARVDFTTDNRCADEDPCTGTAEDFPDVPTDLDCPAGTCQESPSFWTWTRLIEITTGVWHQAQWQDAGQWELDYSFPDPPQDADDEGLLARSYPKLWLDSIDRIDAINGTVDVPATTFDFEWLDNRVNHPAGVAAMTMARLDIMTNELGGETRFAYGQSHPCVVGQVYTSQQHANLDCFRAWDLTQDVPPVPGMVMWHKYKVLSSAQDSMLPTGGAGRAEPITMTYTYGAPQWVAETGPLPPKDSSGTVLWTEWRGHEDVTATTTSTAYTDYRFHRGLGGTYNLSDGTNVTDLDQFNGQLAEVSAHPPGGSMTDRTITQYESTQTASMPSDNGTQYAHFVAPDVVRTTALGATRTDTSRVEYDYDSYGNVTFERLLGDNTPSESKRTVQYVYYPNTTTHVVSLPGVVRLTSGWRNAGNPAPFGEDLARTEILYDENDFYWNAPGAGNPTNTRVYYQDLTDTLALYYYRESITGYDSKGRVDAFTDARQAVLPEIERLKTLFEFDTFGHVDKVTNPLAQATDYVTDPRLGVVTSVTDPNSQATTASYDGMGRLTGVHRSTDPGTTEGITYDYRFPVWGGTAGDDTVLLTTTTKLNTSDSVVSATHYDGLGRVVQSDAPRAQNAGQTVVGLTDYDPDGRPVRQGVPFTISNAPGALYLAGDVWVSWGVVYDETTYAGNTTTSTRKQGATSIWSSQSVRDGWENETTDAEGKATQYMSDAFGQLRTVEEHDGAATFTTAYGYDLGGNLESVTDDANNTTLLTYDRLGQKRTMDDPDSGTWTYTYDEVGDLASQQDGRGDWVHFIYDDLNRITERHADSPTGTLLADYVYDGPRVGALDKSTAYSTAGSVVVDHLGYDNAGRVESRKLTLPGSQSFAEAFTYDLAGNIDTRTYPGGATGTLGEVVDYAYDSVSGLPLTLVGDGTFTNDDYVTSTVWDQAGLITAQQTGTGNGLYWDPAYDVHTRLSRSLVKSGTGGGAVVQDYNYIRNDLGYLTRIWDVVDTDQYQCFTYDDLHRLTGAFTGNAGCGYYAPWRGTDPFNIGYDHNSIGNLTLKGGVTLTYGAGTAGPHAVTKYGTDDFAFDLNGNMTSRDIPGDTQTLSYDDDHRLISVSDTSRTTDFLYDAEGNRVKRSTSTEATAYVGGMYEYTTAGAGTTETSYYSLAGRTVAVRHDSDLTYLAQDHLGSTAIGRNASTGVVEVSRYLPFGDPRGASAPTATDHTYTGQIADASTDLMFYNARYYDPGIGRFISPDTIVPDFTNPQDLNRYSYVGNSPINYTDPTGRSACALSLGAGLVTGPIGPGAICAIEGGIAILAGMGIGWFAREAIDEALQNDQSPGFTPIQLKPAGSTTSFPSSGGGSIPRTTSFPAWNPSMADLWTPGFTAGLGSQALATPGFTPLSETDIDLINGALLAATAATRRAALRQAKRDAGIPYNLIPIESGFDRYRGVDDFAQLQWTTWLVGGKAVTLEDHHLGHTFKDGGARLGPHIKNPETKKHYFYAE